VVLFPVERLSNKAEDMIGYRATTGEIVITTLY
jgi:hypothetical protein